MLVVLDTNVIVSGLLNGEGKPGKIIDLVLDNRIQVAYDDRILGEYEDVLTRPELNIRPALVKAVIAHIELTGQIIQADALSGDDFQDPEDMPFVEVFITAKAQALVTGNLRHFSYLIDRGLEIFTPTRFIESFFPE